MMPLKKSGFNRLGVDVATSPSCQTATILGHVSWDTLIPMKTPLFAPFTTLIWKLNHHTDPLSNNLRLVHSNVPSSFVEL